MSSTTFFVFTLSILFAISFFPSKVEGSVAQSLVKKGDRLDVDFFSGARAIKREVPAGTQIWNFDGKNAGFFVNEKGEKIEMDYSNYDSAKNGALVIKKFSKADVGNYQEEPNEPITSQEADGTITAKAGPVIQISIEE